jgi:hypothetical protein
MCRNIKPLFNYEPTVTSDEVRAASLQFVRKVSGFTKPSHANQAAFDHAVGEVAQVVQRLMDSLVTAAEPRDRDEEAARAKARAVKRFARTAVLLLASLAGAGSLAAQQPDSLSLDRLFASAEFQARGAGQVRWLDNGGGYSALAPSTQLQGGTDIVRVDPRTNARTVLVPAGQLVPAGRTARSGCRATRGRPMGRSS